MPETQLTDHESILLIRQELQSLKDSQADFHKEMRTAFADLKDNYAGRLNEHDIKIADLIATRNDFRNKISDVNVYLRWIGVGIGILASMLIYHMTGFQIK